MSTAGNKNIPVGLAVDTQTAPVMSAHKVKATGQATEASTPLQLTVRHGYPIGIAETTDTTSGLSRRKVKTLGMAVESDSVAGLGYAGQKLINVQLVVETDATGQLTVRRSTALGVGEELDTAHSHSVIKTRVIGVAEELDSAPAFLAKVGYVPALHPTAQFGPGMGSAGTVVPGRTAEIVSHSTGAQVVRNTTTTWRLDE